MDLQAFIVDARVDVKLQIVEEVTRHLGQTWWTIGVDTHGQAGDPGVIEEWSELEIVIGVVMSDKDVPNTI